MDNHSKPFTSSPAMMPTYAASSARRTTVEYPAGAPPSSSSPAVASAIQPHMTHASQDPSMPMTHAMEDKTQDVVATTAAVNAPSAASATSPSPLSFAFFPVGDDCAPPTTHSTAGRRALASMAIEREKASLPSIVSAKEALLPSATITQISEEGHTDDAVVDTTTEKYLENDVFLSLTNLVYKDVMFAHFPKMKNDTKEERERMANEVCQLFKSEGGRLFKMQSRKTGDYVQVDDGAALEKIKADFKRRMESAKHWLTPRENITKNSTTVVAKDLTTAGVSGQKNASYMKNPIPRKSKISSSSNNGSCSSTASALPGDRGSQDGDSSSSEGVRGDFSSSGTQCSDQGAQVGRKDQTLPMAASASKSRTTTPANDQDILSRPIPRKSKDKPKKKKKKKRNKEAPAESITTIPAKTSKSPAESSSTTIPAKTRKTPAKSISTKTPAKSLVAQAKSSSRHTTADSSSTVKTPAKQDSGSNNEIERIAWECPTCSRMFEFSAKVAAPCVHNHMMTHNPELRKKKKKKKKKKEKVDTMLKKKKNAAPKRVSPRLVGTNVCITTSCPASTIDHPTPDGDSITSTRPDNIGSEHSHNDMMEAPITKKRGRGRPPNNKTISSAQAVGSTAGKSANSKKVHLKASVTFGDEHFEHEHVPGYSRGQNNSTNSVQAVTPAQVVGHDTHAKAKDRSTPARAKKSPRDNLSFVTPTSKNANKFIFSTPQSSMDASIAVPSGVDSNLLLGSSETDEPISCIVLKSSSAKPSATTKRKRPKSKKVPTSKRPSKKAHKEVDSSSFRLAPKRKAFANACNGIQSALSEQEKHENADTFSDEDSDDEFLSVAKEATRDDAEIVHNFVSFDGKEEGMVDVTYNEEIVPLRKGIVMEEIDCGGCPPKNKEKIPKKRGRPRKHAKRENSSANVSPSQGDVQLDSEPFHEAESTLESVKGSGEAYEKASFQFSDLFQWSPITLRSPAKLSKILQHCSKPLDISPRITALARGTAASSHHVSNIFPCNDAWSQEVLTTVSPSNTQRTLPSFSPIKLQELNNVPYAAVTFPEFPSVLTMFTPTKLPMFTPTKQQGVDMNQFSWHSRAGSIAGLPQNMSLDIDNLLVNDIGESNETRWEKPKLIDFVAGTPKAGGPQKKMMSSTPKRSMSKMRHTSPLSVTPRKRRISTLAVTGKEEVSSTRYFFNVAGK
eukprot:CAMPEP_0172306826 /NCGR_PEP_ID=MMETSP1058-20130122/7809_1 /TAXON_ID=83371 /ORGANISM="Detonula confervacea, Strain CCMP 353" /LENGTH=1185 /DNA_ID=CAMNT_0013018827 /DNA_START=104 /DNA_END=3661 /DNA_ORIENTATION=+